MIRFGFKFEHFADCIGTFHRKKKRFRSDNMCTHHCIVASRKSAFLFTEARSS